MNDDLFFSGRLLSVLRTAGFEAQVEADAGAAVESASRGGFDLAIVNANSRGIDTPALIGKLRAETPVRWIIAFLSHTRIPEARDRILGAGADRLCANSAITMRLPDIVHSVMSAETSLPQIVE